jgi:hypothetical protein
MAGVIFDSRPARTLKADVTVMLERTRDELPAIRQLWPRFEDLVGLRGRRMYAMVDVRAGSRDCRLAAACLGAVRIPALPEPADGITGTLLLPGT